MKRILVTGGLGYVGGRVVKYLLENSSSEIIISSRRDADVETIFESNRVKLYSANNLIDDATAFPYRFDAIIHLAATNEIQAAADSADSIRVNIHDSYLLLQKAIKHKIKRFVYFSTAHVYCSPLQGEITEEFCPKPIHPYAITHKGFEDFLWAAHHKNEIEGIIIRLSNSFGVPFSSDVNRWTLLVNDLCRQAVSHKQMILNSSGLQLRDFVTLTDVCRAVDHLLQLPAVKLQDGIFNLGGNHVISVFEMALLIQQRLYDHFKIKVELHRASFNQLEKVISLKFHSSRLAQSGFVWKNNIEEEIDSLIKFCIKNFS